VAQLLIHRVCGFLEQLDVSLAEFAGCHCTQVFVGYAQFLSAVRTTGIEALGDGFAGIDFQGERGLAEFAGDLFSQVFFMDA
tara:strand:- start:35 stop:280 length:246 start_codon:yes stop_codon:yes gene_type:complete